MEYVLRVQGLSKRYKGRYAVARAEMNICAGDIYGFVGENGAGKTTIIRMVTGLVTPDEGKFELFGVPNDSPEIGVARRRVGAIVENPSVYQNLSAYDNLKMQCLNLGKGDDNMIRYVLEEVGLGALFSDKKKAGDYSLGMRQRLGIAMALLGEPEFLILDEPMNGLDPAGIVGIRELILRLNRERGITFLISSHILTELSLVATKYGIISGGRLIREITDTQLHAACAKTTFIQTDTPMELSNLLQELLPKHGVMCFAEGVKITGDVDLNQVFGAIIEKGIRILSVTCAQQGIEDYYLSVIGGGVRG
ncbi:MAG: ATP-binding cassette domain-containing protein [Oscillospiraceae bacterium]|nr:ATP-binding cassette domain-containing protein [Oscillospiraceae bacterium]